MAATDARSPAGRPTSRWTQVALLASGYTLLALGAVLLVLPGPGVVVLLAGLAVVGRQQHWARRVELRVRDAAVRPFRRVRASRRGTSPCSVTVPRSRDR